MREWAKRSYIYQTGVRCQKSPRLALHLCICPGTQALGTFYWTVKSGTVLSIIKQLHDRIVLSTFRVLWGSLHLRGGCQVHLQHAPKSKGFFSCPPLSVVTVSQSWPWVWCFVHISHRHIYPSPSTFESYLRRLPALHLLGSSDSFLDLLWF